MVFLLSLPEAMGGGGGGFSDSHHENLSVVQNAKFTGVWEPQGPGLPGFLISQAGP